jgi:hypothetical protein
LKIITRRRARELEAIFERDFAGLLRLPSKLIRDETRTFSLCNLVSMTRHGQHGCFQLLLVIIISNIPLRFQMIKMMLAVVGVFIFCWLPFNLFMVRKKSNFLLFLTLLGALLFNRDRCFSCHCDEAF